ncbi:MAG: hypothetical protein KC620_05785 [Myxococcales bacterium]|nr:hypothetical protein [Myxococcales bacterium]
MADVNPLAEPGQESTGTRDDDSDGEADARIQTVTDDRGAPLEQTGTQTPTASSTGANGPNMMPRAI